MLSFIYSNITRTDILNQINFYNSIRPQAEHIFIFPTQQDIKITKHCGTKWKGEKEAQVSHSEVLSVWNKATDETSHTPPDATCNLQVPRRSVSPEVDNVPLWLGMPGFEERTTEWFAEHASERARHLSTYAEEERREEELATFKSTTIDNSKNRLLDLLRKYADEIQRGKIKMNEEVGLVLEHIMAHAKGKYQMVDEDKPVEFTSLLEYQNSLLKTLKSREDELMYAWWCYSKQCVATDTNIDEDVVVAAKSIIALTSGGTEEEVPEEVERNDAPDENTVKESGAKVEHVRSGYESLKQVISEQDKRYPRYLEEILHETSMRSGVGVDTILAQANEVQETKAEAKPVKTLG